MGEEMPCSYAWFQKLCALPNVMGAIKDTHIFVSKLYGAFLEDYFYHKTRGYNIGVQVVVDIKKKFQKKVSYMCMLDYQVVSITIMY